MKLDEISEKEITYVMKTQKKERSNNGNYFQENSNAILELLNPLIGINTTTFFQSIGILKQLKVELEKLIEIQSNNIFYILHQNFMCDDAHKEFFINMVGRFYDMPEWSWDYYKGDKYFAETGNRGSLLGLVLLENCKLYQKCNSGNSNLLNHSFKAKNPHQNLKLLFNRHALKANHGIDDMNNELSDYFRPCITGEIHGVFAYVYGFKNRYENGRFEVNSNKILGNTNAVDRLVENYWFLPTINNINVLTKNNYEMYPYFATFRFDELDTNFKTESSNLENTLDISFSKNEKMLIRSLSQTFPWTKEYIFENEKILNLDVLGLNMTVPWDFELVKFFIDKGYGGRMSENKAVFDKLFEPLLTDEIIKMLFKLEYEKY